MSPLVSAEHQQCGFRKQALVAITVSLMNINASLILGHFKWPHEAEPAPVQTVYQTAPI